MMVALRVVLFGRFQVESEHGTVGGLEARKVQELFSYLLLHRDQLHARESLADLLWGDCPTAHSKKNLRQTLWQLQSALQAALAACHGEDGACHVLIAESEWLGINPALCFALDVAQFEAAFCVLEQSAGRMLTPDESQLVEDAVQMYRGNLLEGWYQDWCLFERERLQNMYLTMLSRLIDYAEAHHLYDKGITYGERILRHDRAHERTHQRLMRLRFLAGDRTAALRQFERCVLALQQELDVRPSQLTLDLHTWIRADGAAPEHSTTPAMLPSLPASADVPALCETLRQLQRMIGEIQTQVQGYLAAQAGASAAPLAPTSVSPGRFPEAGSPHGDQSR
jgi:DNA-binding SARP family transcriptional activator